MNHAGDGFNLLKLLLRPPLKFIGTYILKRGFLDGLPGFIIAVTSSFYVFLRYAKLWELQKQGNASQDSKHSHE